MCCRANLPTSASPPLSNRYVGISCLFIKLLAGHHMSKCHTTRRSLQDRRLCLEDSLAADGADTWVMSSYLLRKPHTLAEKQAGWQPPWLCEVQVRRCWLMACYGNCSKPCSALSRLSAQPLLFCVVSPDQPSVGAMLLSKTSACLQGALEGQGVEAAGSGELQDGDMHWTVDIIAARCVEKMLDVLAGGLRQGGATIAHRQQ